MVEDVLSLTVELCAQGEHRVIQTLKYWTVVETQARTDHIARPYTGPVEVRRPSRFSRFRVFARFAFSHISRISRFRTYHAFRVFAYIASFAHFASRAFRVQIPRVFAHLTN
jgi:hypothetical protein